MYRQIILSLLLLSVLPLRAQTEVQPPLQTQQVIQRYRRAKNAVYVELGKDLLTRYDASYCYTLQLLPSGKELEAQWSDVEQALDADRKVASIIKEQIELGRLLGAYYRFSSKDSKIHRYLLYSYDNRGVITLVSIGGTLQTEELIQRILTPKSPTPKRK